MRTFISNADEKLKINGFLQLNWTKKREVLIEPIILKKIFELSKVSENIKNNNGYYYTYFHDNTILGFLANIGKCEHPLVELAYACSWYNSNFGGIYLIGVDNVKNEYFAPIKKSN